MLESHPERSNMMSRVSQEMFYMLFVIDLEKTA